MIKLHPPAVATLSQHHLEKELGPNSDIMPVTYVRLSSPLHDTIQALSEKKGQL